MFLIPFGFLNVFFEISYILFYNLIIKHIANI